MKCFQQLRHNAVQKDLLQLAQRGAIRARDSGLGGLLEEDGRKGDLLLAGIDRSNTDLVLDITIANPCCNSYLLIRLTMRNTHLPFLKPIRSRSMLLITEELESI
jgi:hypothetical protein